MEYCFQDFRKISERRLYRVKSKFKFLIVFILSFTMCYGQEFRKISGYIRDSATYEALIGAAVVDTISGRGIYSNNFGYFSIHVPVNTGALKVSYVGFKSGIVSLNNSRMDTIVQVFLGSGVNLKEVVVYGRGNNRLATAQTGMEFISAKTIRSLPVIMGESDLTRTLLLLPGVSFGTENTSGYFVRGGNTDQNMLLIDGVPVYNAYHLYGFFSVFNTDAINTAKLYKGDMPARFGSRLSSVLDLQMKEGNAQKFSGSITGGLVASKFLLEGPILKGKTSYLVTGRRSMMDLMPGNLLNIVRELTGMSKIERDINLPSYRFYDLSGKINHAFSNRSRLYLSFYNGDDNFIGKTALDNYTSSLNWGNTTASLRWNYVFPSNLFANVTLYHSRYNYLSQKSDLLSTPSRQEKIGSGRSFYSAVQDYSAKIDMDYNIAGHSLKFGMQYIIQQLKPGVNTFHQSTFQFDNNIDTSYNFNKTLFHTSVYVENNFNPISNLTVNAGLHAANVATGSKQYVSLQPRLSLCYMLLKNVAAKASYTRMVQPLHLLSGSSLGGPSDIWVPSTPKVKPATANQFVAGITWQVNNHISITAEVFGKKMNHLIAYKEGASYMVEKSDWQDKVETGTGKARGFELSLNKETGNTTGWIAYTWSQSTRRFENINFGRKFPHSGDRTHNFSIALMHKFNRKFSVGADWVYATGNPVTLANTYVYDGYLVTGTLRYYNAVNGVRLQPYHRLDMSLNYHGVVLRKFEYTLSAGAYNVYNRANPYFLVDSPERVVAQSLFPVLPYVSFSVKF